ncbi:DedA family protein [Melissospora conviva]|uniref:DedA family protein n=1 Tax=Melissospora conviva TaxID=3388432 RepID=UPI003B8000D7
MPEALLALASPSTAYLVLFGLLVVDAFVPVVPTQAIMITGGALTVYGGLSLPMTIAVGALGVFVGDLACYLLGRHLRRRAPDTGVDPTRPGLIRRALQRAGRLHRPGPVSFMLCRFVPGGRMAACFHAGRSRYPARRFLAYEVTAALAWAAYGTLAGRIGGRALAGAGWELALVAAVTAGLFGGTGWILATLANRRRAIAEATID